MFSRVAPARQQTRRKEDHWVKFPLDNLRLLRVSQPTPTFLFTLAGRSAVPSLLAVPQVPPMILTSAKGPHMREQPRPHLKPPAWTSVSRVLVTEPKNGSMAGAVSTAENACREGNRVPPETC